MFNRSSVQIQIYCAILWQTNMWWEFWHKEITSCIWFTFYPHFIYLASVFTWQTTEWATTRCQRDHTSSRHPTAWTLPRRGPTKDHQRGPTKDHQRGDTTLSTKSHRRGHTPNSPTQCKMYFFLLVNGHLLMDAKLNTCTCYQQYYFVKYKHDDTL